MGKSYIRERKRDYYYRKAKSERYRSRAVYKLLEAIKKFNFIREGDVVVDLGATPGGWTQVCTKIVGERGFVLAIDLRPLKPFKAKNVLTIVKDIRDKELPSKIMSILGRKVDVVVSDVSPNLSGVWEVDHARQIKLACDSLNIAECILKEGGNFFVKIFEGDLKDDFLKKMKEKFRTVRVFRPKATRKRSSEIYFLGLRYGT